MYNQAFTMSTGILFPFWDLFFWHVGVKMRVSTVIGNTIKGRVADKELSLV